ncbi:AbiV family abortive infection protein [Algibacter amylolyticus]|uniref:AbiV family abortive infection protein n=1 Tax=Algibacter amylolyticus TaxID=1608400 RepID=A0A5M7B9Y7_9FLAO|nr:AbiV family abortive infection protein [Algibacter amylolyticus]KAA5826252.1 AbiV family abortive infection protein [Algibacter amylolyticus]MBB5268455.1 AbiV family abortive infection protein [Algibacter amylolyticus]TSJ80290.1 AbiV family abortive infection protein [Algibacter amylolyticus]
MRKFINLSAIESRGLDIVIYNNARQLRKDAILLAETNKSYSSATSLLILSSEEVIKATLVFLHSQGYKVYLIKGAKRFFSDHKIRHEVAQLVEVGSSLMETITIWEEQREKPLFKTKVKWLDWGLNGLNDLVKSVQPLVDSGKRIEKLQEFNDLKNQGLYVNYKDKLLTPQFQIDADEYTTVKNIVERTFKFYKSLRLLYHPSIEKHLSKKKIMKVREDLELLINDAFKDFEFNNNRKSYE